MDHILSPQVILHSHQKFVSLTSFTSNKPVCFFLCKFTLYSAIHAAWLVSSPPLYRGGTACSASIFAYAHVHYTNNNNYIASCGGGLWEQG